MQHRNQLRVAPLITLLSLLTACNINWLNQAYAISNGSSSLSPPVRQGLQALIHNATAFSHQLHHPTSTISAKADEPIGGARPNVRPLRPFSSGGQLPPQAFIGKSLSEKSREVLLASQPVAARSFDFDSTVNCDNIHLHDIHGTIRKLCLTVSWLLVAVVFVSVAC